MKKLRTILNQRFLLIVFLVTMTLFIAEYFQLKLFRESYKQHSLDMTNLIAQRVKSQILTDSAGVIKQTLLELNEQQKYHGLSVYDFNDKIISSVGELVQNNLADNIHFTSDHFIVRKALFDGDNFLGTLCISFKLLRYKELYLQSVFIILFCLSLLLIIFYIFLKSINKIIIFPVNKLIESIYNYESESVKSLSTVNSKISEIHELKENFSNLILQINFSKKQLEQWNKNLEIKVEDKTKKLTEALNQTKKFQNKIIAQEKLASLGGLSAGIAHELKNPLNIIINSSQLITMKVTELANKLKQVSDDINLEDDMKEVDEICEIMNSSSKRADRIIRSMLSQARSQSSKKEVHHLSEICKEALNLSYHAMRAKPDCISVEIKESIQEGIYYLCYFEEIERVIINLVDNSFDALREKKEKETDFQPQVTISLKEKVDSIILEISDNGIGIPPDLIERIKEPFFTTKPTGKGTGLGITMINDIVLSLSGELFIESEINQYTKFTLILPKDETINN